MADDVVSYSQHYAQPKNALGAPTTTSTLVDSWYLVQAESYDGQSVITFDYEYEAYTFRNLGTSSRTIVDRDGRNLINLNESSFNNLNPVLATESLSPRLTEIRTTETSILFHYGPEKRRDLDHDFNTNYHPKNVVPIPPAQVNDATALDYIEVKSLSPSGCLKRFDFGQSYFTSPAIGFTGTLGLTQYNDVFGDYYADMRRLRLNQISEQSCALTDNKTHRFTYKSNTFQRRLTYAQDHHGYPNNRTDNITLMPQLTIQGSANQVPKIDLNHLATLADRKPNAFYTEQMMLDSIIYPSGGSTVFDYEGHNHYSSDVQETGSNLVDLRNQNCASPQPPPSCTSCCLAQELTSPVVTLDPSSIIRHEMRVTVTKTPNDNSNTLIQVPIEIKRGNANWQLFDEIILNTANEFNQVKCYSELLFEQAGVTDYRFRISADVNRKLFMQLLVKKYERTDIMRNIAVGGLRIKSITDDPVIGPSITRSYDYTEAGSNNSSGQLIGVPSYLEELPSDAELNINNDCIETGYYFTSGNAFPMATANGSHIGYRTVREEVSGANGYKEYTFYDDPTHTASFIRAFPLLPDYDLDNLAGYPNEVKAYRENGSLVSSQTTTYDAYEYALNNKSYSLNDYSTCPAVIFTNNSYTPKSKYVYPIQSINQLDDVETMTDYVHGDPSHPTLLTSSQSINSDGRVYKTRYHYTNEYTDDPHVKQSMLNKNILLPAWKTKYIVDDTLVDASRVLWQYYNTQGNVTLNTGIVSALDIHPHTSWRYEATWDESNDFVPGVWDLQKSIPTYNLTYGLPENVTTSGWTLSDDYAYSLSGKVLSHTYGAYVTTSIYHPDSDLLQFMTNIDGTSTSYTYDGLLRLSRIKDNQRNITTDFTYQYTNSSTNRSYLEQTVTYPQLGLRTNHPLTTRSYIDGLGRLLEMNQKAQGPTASQSIITSTSYDNAGRISRSYEPRSVNNDSLKYEGASGPHTLYTYEPSPLNRKLMVTSPETWLTTSYSYGANVSSDVSGYLSDLLYKATVTDANNNKTESYTDRRGRDILSRSFDGALTHDTYQAYDAKDRLTGIRPPGAMSTDTDLLFKYRYAGNDLILEEYIPGKGATTYIYSTRDQVIYWQDPLMKDQNDNLHYAKQYDAYGQLHREGWRKTNIPANDTQADGFITTLCAVHTWGDGTVPRETGKIIKSRIDDIDDLIVAGSGGMSPLNYFYTYNNAGLVSSKLYNHENYKVDKVFREYYTYDSADNLTKERYDFKYSPSQSIEFNFSTDYDHAGRKSGQWFGQGPTARQNELCRYTFDAKSLLSKAIIGGGVETINYSYLKNRMVQTQNSATFSSTLYYNNTSQGQTTRKNGDISSWVWTNNGVVGLYNFEYDGLNRLKKAKYNNVVGGKYSAAYLYDRRGNFSNIMRDNGNGQQIDNLSFSIGSGNRLNSVLDLASGAKAEGFNGGALRSFVHDANGNINADGSRSTTTGYNYLNLPFEVNSTLNNDKIKYEYDFGGTLMRISETVGSTTTHTDYIGPLEYESVNGGTSTIKRINHEHGYIQMTGINNGSVILPGTQNTDRDEYYRVITGRENVTNGADVNYWGIDCILLEYPFQVSGTGTEFLADFKPYGGESYFWTVKDHKQNVRTILDNNGGILDHFDYYPFNLKFNYNSNPNYEWNIDGGLEQKGLSKHLDLMAFRICDRTTGRFLSVDPLSNIAPNWTGYRMSFNNPISYTDPLGLFETRESALAYAQDNGIRLGFFRRNKIREQSDGSYAIVNRKRNTFTQDLGEDIGVVFGVTIVDTPIDKTKSIRSADLVHNVSSSTTAITGIGLNWQQLNRYGNTGSRFRADLFDQKYIRLSGQTGEKIVSGLKYSGPIASLGSAALTINSNQSLGWKTADLTSTGIGVFGGPYGAAASVIYGVGIKNLVRPVISPTTSELKQIYQFQYKYSRTYSCNRSKCN